MLPDQYFTTTYGTFAGITSNNMKYFIYFVIIVIAVAVVSGFFIVGSPKEERMRRFDEQRVQSLQTIQSYIGEFYRAKANLPQNLDELNDTFREIIVAKDPETGASFEYEARGNLTFSLCANFNRPSELVESIAKPAVPHDGPFGREAWEHGEGRFCFERAIDKDFFQPLKIPR